MRRCFITLMLTVVMSAMVVGWAPIAKSQVNGDGSCLEF